MTAHAPAVQAGSVRWLIGTGVLLGAVAAGAVFDQLTATPGSVLTAVVETVQQLLPGAVGGEQISDAAT